MSYDFHLCLICVLVVGCAAELPLEQQVHDRILQQYKTTMRPVTDQNTPIGVEIDPELYNVVNVDGTCLQTEICLTYRVPHGNCLGVQRWKDELLTWNESDFNNIKHIRLASQEIWTPDIIVANTISNKELYPFDQLYAVVQSDGSVSLTVNRLLEIGCSFDVAKFPFDTQRCQLEFSSWSYRQHELAIRPVGHPHHLKYFKENSEWTLQAYFPNTVSKAYSQIRVIEPPNRPQLLDIYSEVHYRIIITRISTFYMFVIVVPTFCITTLCLIGLFTPFSSTGERQERVTLGLMTLLSMSVILHVVTNEVPKSSRGLPLLGKYVLYEFCMSTFGTIVTVFLIFLHQRAITRGWSPPRWWCNDCMEAIREFDFSKGSKKWERVGVNDDDLKTSEATETLLMIKILTKCSEWMKLCGEHLGLLVEAKLKGRRYREGWNRLFCAVDLVMLALFLLANMVLTIFLFSPVFKQDALLCKTCLHP